MPHIDEEEYMRLRIQAELSKQRAPKAARIMATVIVLAFVIPFAACTGLFLRS